MYTELQIKSYLQNNCPGQIYCSDFKYLYIDKMNIGTNKYTGQAYFWSSEYRELRADYFTSTTKTPRQIEGYKRTFRKAVHRDFLKSNLQLDAISDTHKEIIDKHYLKLQDKIK